MSAVRVIVAGSETRSIRDSLERAGFRVVAEAESADKAVVLAGERDAAVIVHGGAPSDVCPPTPPIVVVLGASESSRAAELGVFGVVEYGASDAAYVSAIEVALARAADLAAAQNEAEHLRDQLETRKFVERAKGILMTRLGLSEPEAYRRLQRASQDENRKMRDVAESIVSTDKILALSQDEPQQHRPTG